MKQVQVTKKEVKATSGFVEVQGFGDIKECPFRMSNVMAINRYCQVSACKLWNGIECSLYKKQGE